MPHLALVLLTATSTNLFAQDLLAQDDGPLELSLQVSTTSIVELQEPPAQAPEGELIRQRFPNGSLQVERWVIESTDGDFVNHGAYTEYNEAGDVQVSGSYRQGKRHGAWNKQLSAEEGKRLLGDVARIFKPPFYSKTEFVEGKLSGDWTCSDSAGDLIFVWTFEDGVREGMSSWFDASGGVLRSISYRRNLAHGLAKVVITKDGKPEDIEFENGKMRHHVEQWYPSEKGKQRSLKSQDWYLVPTPLNLAAHDWAASHIEYQAVDAEDKLRHGRSVSFYKNGQRESEGNYEYGQRTGTFAWWYSNGQEKTIGEYQSDREQGQWTWWHQNGMKEASGSFTDGEKTATWSVWDETGKLVKRAETGVSHRRLAGRTSDVDRR